MARAVGAAMEMARIERMIRRVMVSVVRCWGRTGWSFSRFRYSFEDRGRERLSFLPAKCRVFGGWSRGVAHDSRREGRCVRCFR